MAIDSFDVLARRVTDASVSSDWSIAVGEWDVVELKEDPSRDGVCICGQTELVKLFTIKNSRNGEVLYPIGSHCVNQFGREDLNRQVSLYIDLLNLRIAVQKVQPIALTSEYFSRATLGYLYQYGAFTPDQYNDGDGEDDYWFLLDMFNKRKKENITPRQRGKIRALINSKIEPFILADPRLKSADDEKSSG